MKIMYIMRGLPGSGKSTLAHHISAGADRLLSGDAPAVIHSTDFYFLDGNLEYKWDPAKTSEYHKLNQQDADFSCSEGVPVVIIDNTNICFWEMRPYLDIAKKYGYSVQFITVGSPWDPDHVAMCAARNVHSVPLAAIQRMSDKFDF